MATSPRQRRLDFDQRILALALGAGFPGSLVALVLLWTGDYTGKVQWTLTVFIVCLWWGFAFAARERTMMPLQTIANLLREERTFPPSPEFRRSPPSRGCSRCRR